MKAKARKSPEPWLVILFYLAVALLIYLTGPGPFLSEDRAAFLFIIPLLLGFAFVGGSVFTTAFCRLWGEKRGELVTSILRNYLGIPLGAIGLILAWLQPAPLLFVAGRIVKSMGGVLMVGGLIAFYSGHVTLGRPAGWPSVRDKLVRDGLYAYVRHPIYAGGLSLFVGAAVLKPTSTVVLACMLGFIWLIVQARLEEIDLLWRMPEYHKYMEEVPRFVPRLWKTQHRSKRGQVAALRLKKPWRLRTRH